MKRQTLLFLILLFLCFVSSLQGMESPKYETRAVWLTTIGGLDWPQSFSPVEQKKQLSTMLDRLKGCGVNTVLVQSRVRSTTIYPSKLEPWDPCMTGKPGKSPGYDPLSLVVEECHRRGMEVQAWVVTIPIGEWTSQGVTELRKKRPLLVKRLGKEAFLNPDVPATADYLAEVCGELVQNYDIDGVHLDYIRYPEQWKGPREKAHITRIVRAIHQKVKGCKPWVKLSCSPVGKHADLARYSSLGWNARDAMGQDAQRWLKEGLMDELYPMMYFQGNQFHPFAIDWAEQRAGANVVPGIGIYFLSPREGKWNLDEVVRQMHTTRNLGLGHAFFRAKFLLDNVKGVYDFVRQFDIHPALPCPSTRFITAPPDRPQRLIRRCLKEGDLLSWQPSFAEGGVRYNVYASDEWPVDTEKAEHLMATLVRDYSVVVPMGSPRYWAVTAVDRYGQESLPLQMEKQQARGGKNLRRGYIFNQATNPY